MVEIITTVFNIIPVPFLAPIWSLSQAIWDSIQQVSDNKNQLKELFNTIVEYLNLLKGLSAEELENSELAIAGLHPLLRKSSTSAPRLLRNRGSGEFSRRMKVQTTAIVFIADYLTLVLALTFWPTSTRLINRQLCENLPTGITLLLINYYVNSPPTLMRSWITHKPAIRI